MMDNKTARNSNRLADLARAKIRQFGREEDGSMIVFTLFLLVLMLIVSGMAVDFMRFESRRAELQGLVDRAVLAAADLDQVSDPVAVVEDYFNAAGMGEHLKGTPSVTPGTDFREVTAVGEITLDTFFLKLIGMDQLQATTASTAIEGVGDIEISLVLDISGSMGFELVSVNDLGEPDGGAPPTMVDPDTGDTRVVTRMDRLQEAAGSFVDALLTDATQDRVSISLVPYSEQVNIGADIFDELSTNNVHDFSYCIEFEDRHFESTAFDLTETYYQSQHVQMNPHYDSDGDLGPDITEPVCPFYEYEAIVPLSQSANYLKGIINQLEPRAGTSIYVGLKWGVTLLDPSIRPVLAALPTGTIDAEFLNRPVDFRDTEAPADPNESNGYTRKYIVLLTDGQNSSSSRLKSEFYSTPSEIAHWDTENFWYFISTDTGWDSSNNWREEVQTPEIGDTRMSMLCDEVADKDIVLFAISLGSSDDPDADDHGWEQMENCASGTGFFYKTSGEELVEIFDAIAEQITDLRLTQ